MSRYCGNHQANLQSKFLPGYQTNKTIILIAEKQSLQSEILMLLLLLLLGIIIIIVIIIIIIIIMAISQQIGLTLDIMLHVTINNSKLILQNFTPLLLD